MLHVTHAPGKALWGDRLGRGTPKVWPSYRSHTSTCAHQLRPGSLDMASVGLLWPVGGRGVCVHTHAHVCTGESALISLSSSSSQVHPWLVSVLKYLTYLESWALDMEEGGKPGLPGGAGACRESQRHSVSALCFTHSVFICWFRHVFMEPQLYSGNLG